MRCMERRFIIWRQELNSSGQDSQEEPRERPRSGLLERAGSWILDTFRGVPGPQQQDEQPSQPTLPWSVGLQRMWDEFQARLGDKEYGSVNLGTTEHAVSCALNVSGAAIFVFCVLF